MAHTAKEILIAGSGIQFLDLSIADAQAVRISQRYFECRDIETESDGPSLHQVDLEHDGTFRHPLTNAVTDPGQTYAVDGRKALEAFAEAWIPCPFIRVFAPAASPPEYTEGPSNWARLYIHRDTISPTETIYRLVLAIDTAVEAHADGNTGAYLAPLSDDIADDTEFVFSADVEAVSWFVTEPWVDEWLCEVFRANRMRVQAEASGAETHEQRALPHLAHYLTLLQTLAAARLIPSIQLAPAAANNDSSVPVDLILDIGASRTFAALAEQGAASSLSPRFEVLPLRDLTRPHVTHSGVMPSRIEFARADFGSEVFSRWSGRTNAFYWPSIARIGVEAARLEREPRSGDIITGLSSPMRYLWDERPSRQLWRFSGAPGAPRRHGIISDPMLSLLSETGEVTADRTANAQTTKPRFSRASLLTFFASECLLHAVSVMNAPAHRWRDNRDGEPRRLERIVVTVPGTMQSAERSLVERRITDAVDLVWRSLGWDDTTRTAQARRPKVVVAADTSTGVALAYMHNELGYKFGGDATAYLGLVGKTRQGGAAANSLRIAALDIGGGSTSLSVVDFALSDTATVRGRVQFQDGFPVGGEAVLKRLVETIVLPAIERHLVECKLADARGVLRAIVERDASGRSPRLVEFRRRFATNIARPAALALLRELEILRSTSEDRPNIRTIGDLLASSGAHSNAALDEFDELASDAGADGFSCATTPIAFTVSEVSGAVTSMLPGVVAAAVHVIRALDCDVVLLSGWLSRLPVVKDMLLSGMPLRPDRILAMHEYRAAAWLPCRSALGNVDDTKTLAAVGAWFSVRSTPAIGGLAFDTSGFSAQPGPAFIGRIEPGGLIPAEACIFAPRGPATPTTGQQAILVTDLPANLGLRRSPLATWPALPMYAIALEPSADDDPPRMPIRLTLASSGNSLSEGVPPAIVRATDADGLDLAPAEISLRLQTMTVPDGDWLDTGAFDIG